MSIAQALQEDVDNTSGDRWVAQTEYLKELCAEEDALNKPRPKKVVIIPKTKKPKKGFRIPKAKEIATFEKVIPEPAKKQIVTYKRFELFDPLMVLNKSHNGRYKVKCIHCKKEYTTTVEKMRRYKCIKCGTQGNHRHWSGNIVTD
jgi:hypothetical protein